MTVKKEHFIESDGQVIAVKKDDYYEELLSLSARDLKDDVVSITLNRMFIRAETGQPEDFGLSKISNIFVSREHARKFAKAILKATK